MALRIDLKHPECFYIGGQWLSPQRGGAVHHVANAANGETAATIRFGGTADIDHAVEAARTAFPAWSATTLEDRIAVLKRVVAIYERRIEDIALAVTAEMGAPLQRVSRPFQAPAGLWHFQTAIALAQAFEFEKDLNAGTRIIKEPIGVIGMITSWNWPLNQVVIKLAPALVVGCTMVLKPSQYAPLSAHILAEIFDEAGVPAGVFNLVHGGGAELGTHIAAHPGIDMVSLTGSNAAGAAVAKAAADSVKRVSLELGGKSPNIILDGPHFARSVENGVRQIMANSGQSCNAPSRMLVPVHRLGEAETIAAAVVASLRVGDPFDEDTDIGPIANARQFHRVQQLIADGLNEGARTVAGGLGAPEGLNGNYARPTVFSDVRNGMTIAQEEIFGPVLCIIPYADEEDAVAIANDTIFGLSAYVGGSTRQDARRIARRLRAGMVHLDDALADLTAPFGGYKQSGNGREWGAWGFEDMLETKAVMGYEAERASG